MYGTLRCGGLSYPTEPPNVRAGTITSVLEIKEAILALSSTQQLELFRRLDEYRAEQWDKEIMDDAAASQLDHLIKEAKEDYRAGRTDAL